VVRNYKLFLAMQAFTYILGRLTDCGLATVPAKVVRGGDFFLPLGAFSPRLGNQLVRPQVNLAKLNQVIPFPEYFPEEGFVTSSTALLIAWLIAEWCPPNPILKTTPPGTPLSLKQVCIAFRVG